MEFNGFGLSMPSQPAAAEIVGKNKARPEPGFGRNAAALRRSLTALGACGSPARVTRIELDPIVDHGRRVAPNGA
jgi:hypothetical protein